MKARFLYTFIQSLPSNRRFLPNPKKRHTTTVLSKRVSTYHGISDNARRLTQPNHKCCFVAGAVVDSGRMPEGRQQVGNQLDSCCLWRIPENIQGEIEVTGEKCSILNVSRLTSIFSKTELQTSGGGLRSKRRIMLWAGYLMVATSQYGIHHTSCLLFQLLVPLPTCRIRHSINSSVEKCYTGEEGKIKRTKCFRFESFTYIPHLALSNEDFHLSLIRN